MLARCSLRAPLSLGLGHIVLLLGGALLSMWGCAPHAAEGASTPVCGNGVLERGEECDGLDGRSTCADGASSCVVCGADCKWVHPQGASCGDGRVDPGEQCDDGLSPASVTCPPGEANCTVCGPACTWVSVVTSVCGDGTRDGAEECDEGPSPSDACPYGQKACSVCSAECKLVAGRPSYCGDGIVTSGEQCDDHNAITEPCAYGQTSCVVCSATCQLALGIAQYCGDGTVNGDEECDDGNDVSERCPYGERGCTVCSNQCKRQSGAVSFCGDGVVQDGEECDDGNDATEACPAFDQTCTVCGAGCRRVIGRPSSNDSCGDGIVNGSEQCDNGWENTDACAPGQTSCTVCNTSCQLAAGRPSPVAGCGDGVQNGTETDVDCGGSCSTRCADGKRCAANGDCVSNRCVWGVCTPAPSWGGPLELATAVHHLSRPQIAVDSAGNAFAVWAHVGGVWPPTIRASRYSVGSGWGAPTRIDVDDTDEAGSPQLALDASGNAVAVWHQSDGTRYNIWSNRYSVGGGWGAPTRIESDDAGDALHPQVAADASGNAVAVWSQSDGARSSIWSNRYSVSGGWGVPVLIESDDAGDAFRPKIALDRSGNGVAVWYQSDGGPYHVWSNRYVAGVWGSPTRVQADLAADGSGPELALDSSGNATVVWTQTGGAGDQIWSNHSDSGAGWDMAVRIDANVHAASPRVAVDRWGNALAVWEGSDGAISNPWYSRRAAGAGWGIAAAMHTSQESATGPDLGFDPSGNAAAVWVQQAGAKFSILTQRFVAGVGWAPATVLDSYVRGTVVGFGVSLAFPRISVDATGNALTIWQRQVDTQYNLWGAVYR